jgi:hypothetical protein
MLTQGHLGIPIDTLLKVILDTLQPSLLQNKLFMTIHGSVQNFHFYVGDKSKMAATAGQIIK